MAAAIWLCRKTADQTVAVIDGIETVIVNQDDLDSEATVLADLHVAVIAAGHPIGAAGYFATADLALASGQLDTDEDMVMTGERLEVIV